LRWLTTWQIDASTAVAPRRMQLACEQILVGDLVAEVMPLHEGLQRPGVRLVNQVVGGDAGGASAAVRPTACG
jgi:hypothetical protein